MLRRAVRLAALSLALAVVSPGPAFDLRSTLTEAQSEWWGLSPEGRVRALLCSRRAGKSVLLARWLVDGARSAGPDEWCVYIALTRASAKKIAWKEVKRAAALTGVPHKVNESELTITFERGGAIMLGGAATVADLERYRGIKIRRAALDEVQSWRDALLCSMIDDVIEPACMDLHGEIALAGTPGLIAKGKWYELTRDGAENETGIPVRRWTAASNPYIRDVAGFLANVLKRNGWCEATPQFVREYLGRWVVDLGQLVFPIVRGRNTCSALPTHNAAGLRLTPDGWRYVISIDVGVRDPTAVVVLAAHRDLAHVRYVLSSEKRSEWLSRDLAARLRDLRKLYPNAPIIADTGGMGAYAAQELTRQWGLAIERADKGQRLGSIHFVRDGLISGTVQILETENQALLDEWDKISWHPKKPGEPADGDDHCSDAVRYGLARLRHWSRADTAPEDRPSYADTVRKEISDEKEAASREAQAQAQRVARNKIRSAKAAGRLGRR